jgi:alanyl-tRNA synthetase
MELSEVRRKYLEFFRLKGHTVIPSALLVPENDPTTLFTSSGMQPLVPYLLGQAHPEGHRLVNSQKSFRADDIDEVGDNRHTTFFEMLGNWSLGDYFKKEQLTWLFEFLTDNENGIGLDPANLYVTVFAGDADMEIPADDESVKLWTELFAGKDIEAKYIQLGSEANGSNFGMQGGRIFSYDVKKNWWSRAGVPSKMPAGEPGGPDSEVFYDFGANEKGGIARHNEAFGKECHPNCDCGRFLEIGNSVFMEYKKMEDGTFERLAQRNVDFGGGLERITAAANNDSDVFHIDVFAKMAEALSPEAALMETEEGVKKERVILDHLRASVFLIGDGVLPSNKGQGYVLRRLLRRAALFSRSFKNDAQLLDRIVTSAISSYEAVYPNLKNSSIQILASIKDEFEKFSAAVEEGLREFGRRTAEGTVTGKDAFDLYQSYGFPWEVTEEIAKERGITVDRIAFEEEFKKHRGLSRTASAGTFKGGLADTSEKTIRLHTTHHLLLRALQQVLGVSVKQKGSNITSERLRLDFLHDAKMTDDQKKEVERLVNEKIAEDLPVIRSEMPREDAEKLGAEHEFGQKYPDRVSVYSVGPKSATLEDPQFDKAFSIEFCGGPHVGRTGEIGHFTIAKEEAVAAGIRRIRGVIE